MKIGCKDVLYTMQTNLHQFGLKPPATDCCFILDYGTMSSTLYFESPPGGSLFVRRVKCNHFGTISLFTRGAPGPIWTPKVTNKRFAPSVPLLKSHIQKCCRRMDTGWAVEGAMLLLAIDPLSLYRRLLIIMVEDVALMEGSATIAWLVLAGTSSTVTVKTVDFVVSFLSSLCTTHSTFVSTLVKNSPICSPQTVIRSHGNQVGSTILSLLLRGSFGGTKGDMLLMSRAYSYYSNAPSLIAPLRGTVKTTDYNVDCDFSVIPQAYDHHVNRNLPIAISRAVGLSIPDVKRILWTAESAPNRRKPYTLAERDHVQKTREYELVISELRVRRLKIERSRKQSKT